MKIISGIRQIPAPLRKSVVTIGNFDGVHLGHRQLVKRVLERAHAAQAASVVMTFEPHPMKVLRPERHLKRLFDLEDQRHELAALGVDYLIIEPFSREFSQLPPERFLLDWIYRPLAPSALVVGYDFSFGANKQGSLEFLREKAANLGFEIEVLAPFKVDDVVVSSSRIRQALGEGDVALAARLLGRRFYIEGIVERGFGRGRTIGVPTANLRPLSESVPKEGVYCGWARVQGKRYQAVVNIGRNPTFTEDGHANPVTIEAHLLDFADDIYGDKMVLEFAERIRDEVKFSSVDELVACIRQDIAAGRKILSESQPLG